jgi:hypothetical protein
MAKRSKRSHSSDKVPAAQTTYRFGIQMSDIHAAARVIRPLLRIRWKAYHEDFWGGDYYLQTRKNGQIIKLHHNYEAYFDHWLQPSFKDYPVLLFMQYPAGVKAPTVESLLSMFEGAVSAIFIEPNSDTFADVDTQKQTEHSQQ